MPIARVGYKALRDSIVTLLADNTSELNYNLKSSVKQIIGGNAFTTPVPATMYPAILVRVDSKAERFVTIGGGRKEIDVVFTVFGMVRVLTSADESDEEAMQLADNIEKIFRDNIDITNNFDFTNPELTEFGIAETSGGTFISLASVRLKATKRIQ